MLIVCFRNNSENLSSKNIDDTCYGSLEISTTVTLKINNNTEKKSFLQKKIIKNKHKINVFLQFFVKIEKEKALMCVSVPNWKVVFKSLKDRVKRDLKGWNPKLEVRYWYLQNMCLLETLSNRVNITETILFRIFNIMYLPFLCLKTEQTFLYAPSSSKFLYSLAPNLLLHLAPTSWILQLRTFYSF